MSTRIFYSVAILTGLFSLVMFLFPQIDLTISNFFYRPQHGFLFGFHYKHADLIGLFRTTLIYFTYGFIAALGLMLVGGLLFKKVAMPLSPLNCLFLLICFAIAPAFIVNDLLKNHWGRARPYQIEQFGGEKNFTPAWVISTECERNCSFTSGETANVFCYLSLLFIVRRKKLTFSIILVLGAVTAFERIGQGDHFFSDTVLSGFLDYLIIWLIYQATIKNYALYSLLGEKNVSEY